MMKLKKAIDLSALTHKSTEEELRLNALLSQTHDLNLQVKVAMAADTGRRLLTEPARVEQKTESDHKLKNLNSFWNLVMSSLPSGHGALTPKFHRARARMTPIISPLMDRSTKRLVKGATHPLLHTSWTVGRLTPPVHTPLEPKECCATVPNQWQSTLANL
jgi:hypothetical protein